MVRRGAIAAGSRPGIPPIPGLAEAGCLTRLTVFDLTEAPASVALIGAGPIGVEFAQVFQRLGVLVLMFEALPRILIKEDPDAASVVRAGLEAEGVTIHVDARIVRVETEPRARLAALAALLVAGALVARATGLLDILHEPAQRAHALEGLLGAASLWRVGPAFSLACFAAVGFALPASLLTLLGGAAFGLGPGVAGVSLGANLGA